MATFGPHTSAAGTALLEGAIDLHVHVAPSVRDRMGDGWDLAEAGAKVGMAGALLKDHDRDTIADAHFVNRRADSSFNCYSSVCLNAPAGGLNASAVESAARMGVNAVFLPTNSAHNDAEFFGRHLGPAHARSELVGETPRRFTPLFSVLDNGGTLTPDAVNVLEACAESSVTVCTGHLSAAEVDAVVHLAAARDLRVVITHAAVFTEATPDQLKAWTDSGAYAEFVYTFCCDVKGRPPILRRSVAGEAALIEMLGPERVILSTDLGQTGRAPPAEGLAMFASGLLAEGIPETALRSILHDNPRRALGLDVDELVSP